MKSNAVKTRCKQGFTLIELLVVVLIIGVLAAVALPQYNKAVIKSRITEYKAKLKTLADAAEACKLSKGSVCALDELDVDIELPSPIPQFTGDDTLAYELSENYVSIYCPYAPQGIRYYYTPHTEMRYDPNEHKVISVTTEVGFYCYSGYGRCPGIGFQQPGPFIAGATLYKE